MIKATHEVVEAIENSELLEDEDKLLALNELVTLSEKYNTDFVGNYNGHDQPLSTMFIWSTSELKHAFWKDINDIVFNGKF